MKLHAKAFENWIFHGLCASNAYREAYARFSYWRLASGIEVDFIVDDGQLAIEAKASGKIAQDHLKGLRALAQDHPRIEPRVVVCLENNARRTEDGIQILPAAEFSEQLSSGKLF